MEENFNDAFDEAENILRMNQAKSRIEKQGFDTKNMLEIREKRTPCSVMSISDGYEVLVTIENLPVAGNEPCACLYMRRAGQANWHQYFATKVINIFPEGFDMKTKKTFSGDEPIRIFDAGVRSGFYKKGKEGKWNNG